MPPTSNRHRRTRPSERCVRIAAWTVLLLIGASVVLHAQEQEKPSSRLLVMTAQLTGQAISPGTYKYLSRAIREAEENNAECLVILLDTPGGLVSTTHDLIKEIIGSRTPVVVYVTPSGAVAGSAGALITISAHVAAMAPTTTIGAAHPVPIAGLPGMPQMPDDSKKGTESDKTESGEESRPKTQSAMEQKVMNYMIRWVRSLAERHGRNAEWAEKAVTESAMATDQEAMELGVIDLIADDLNDLLAKIDGREVRMGTEESLVLNTKNPVISSIEMWWGEQVLVAIANPNFAAMLLMFGFLGIVWELYSPGWGVGGTLGVICLVIGFYGISMLPYRFGGLALIIIAMALFAAEMYVTSFGTLTLGGVICLVLGGLMLIDSPDGAVSVSIEVILPMAAAMAAIVLILGWGVVRTHTRKAQMGDEAMVGRNAIAKADFVQEGARYAGTVMVHGELWSAVSAHPVENRQALTVVSRDGLKVEVNAPRSARTHPPAQTNPPTS